MEDLLFEAEVFATRKTDVGVLPLQIGHLVFGAFDEPAGEKIIGQDNDLHHAEPHLSLRDPFQARMGDAGKGDVHQIMFAALEEPVRHFRYMPIGYAIRGTASEQDDTGIFGIRHMELPHGLIEPPF